MSKIFGTLMKTVYSVGNIPIDIKQKRLDPIKAQEKELRKLLRKASHTAFGEHYNFDDILNSDDIFNTYREKAGKHGVLHRTRSHLRISKSKAP